MPQHTSISFSENHQLTKQDLFYVCHGTSERRASQSDGSENLNAWVKCVITMKSLTTFNTHDRKMRCGHAACRRSEAKEADGVSF